MPVMVFYKDKGIPDAAAEAVIQEIADLTRTDLDAKIEVRVLEPKFSFNANEVHIEMRFRDFDEWTDEQVTQYHQKVMAGIGRVLKKHKASCQYSFYIIPTMPPRSLWAQGKP